MKNVIDFYNKTATGWSDEFLKDKKQSEIVSKFYECFSKAGLKHPKILDLGCGFGYDSKLLYRLGAKMTGIDLSENSIQIAKKKVATCRFFVGDISQSMSSLGKFDGVLCLATLIHIDLQKMTQTFANISKVTKKGGLLLISMHEGIGKDYDKSYVNIDGEEYDKDFNSYSLHELCSFAYPNFKLVDCWKFDDFDEGWRYYVFMKQ